MRVMIFGCGYVGTPLGARLVGEGHTVYGMRRNGDAADQLQDLGIIPVLGDVSNPDMILDLPDNVDWIVNTVSSSKGGADVYREVYLKGSQHILSWLKTQDFKRYIYTGSTSVYAQKDGGWVDETSPTEPENETGRILVETEKLLFHGAMQLNMPLTILRVAGIYGPGRGHLFLKYLTDQATMTGDGSKWINMIHLQDLVDTIVRLFNQEYSSTIYNVCDDQPVRQRDFFRFLSATLGKDMPPSLDPAAQGTRTRKRGDSNKRISNALLHEHLDLDLRFPSYQEGYLNEIKRLTEEGRLTWHDGRAVLQSIG